jgi:SAM-dependent methyltransferase
MSNYTVPSSVLADTGSGGAQPEQRITDILKLMEYAPLGEFATVLDVGIGKGQLTRWLCERGKKVVGTGLEVDSYGIDRAALRAAGVEVMECSVEKMPFPDGSFDAVVMSHILEHCPNVGLALAEVRRVLKTKGWLLLFVPPADDLVNAGHVSVGWNVGQLMYVLLLNGFDLKTGKFVEFGYNIAAFVRRSEDPLPPLRMDRGDISILQSRFPVPIRWRDGSNDGFFGRVSSVNWPDDFFRRHDHGSRKSRAIRAIARNLPLPRKLRLFAAAALVRLGQLMRHDSLRNPPSFGHPY